MAKNKTDIVLVALGLVCASVLGGTLTSQSISTGWYDSIIKSSLQPPDFIFGPVWVFLYFCMFASYILARGSARELDVDYQAIMGVNLLVNLAWTIVFFGFERTLGGLLVLSAYLAVVLGMVKIYFKYDRRAGCILLPLAGWVGFAWYLNFAIVVLN